MTELEQSKVRTIAGNKGFVRLGVVAALLVVGMLVQAPSAHAVTFDLTSDHCTGGCGTAPFGTVTVTANGTGGVDVTVSLNDSNQFVLTGSADDQYFKFNGAQGAISVTQNVSGVTLIGDTGAFNGDGTGNFSFGISCTPIAPHTTCASGGSAALPVGTVLTFSVASTTVAQLTQPNNAGNIFVADILSGTTGNTGPVDVHVPEPASILLLGFALTGVGAAMRRLRRKE